jgi:hypothetical protein
MVWAQFLVTRLSQKTLPGLIFSLAVVGAGGVQGPPMIGPEAFATSGTLDPPLCEKIKDTLGKTIIVLKLACTKKYL